MWKSKGKTGNMGEEQEKKERWHRMGGRIRKEGKEEQGMGRKEWGKKEQDRGKRMKGETRLG